jgi:Tol biopolymer transport system component
MEMMAPIQEEKPWKLNNANYFSRKRLPSDMMYVSGYYMTEYISKNAGEDVWAKITDKYSSNPFGGFGRYVKSVTGKNMNDWYTDVVNEFKTKSKKSPFLGQVLPSAQANLPNADFSPRWSDENTIIAYHLDFDGLPQLTAINLNGTREKLFECLLMNETSNFSVSKQYIAMGEVNINKKYSATQYADLYLYDRILKTQCQLTFNRRIFSPDISPDETNIAAIQNRADHTTLVIVTITTGEIKFLLDVPAYNILNPRWSPNGREIACIIKDETGQQDVAVVNAETGTFTFPYNHDWYHDNTPCWTPDGKYILYTSDRSGIFNIWAVLTATGERFQVTDVDLGAFMPDVSPDGKNITCNVYSYNGFSAAILPFDTQNWKKESDVSTGTNSLLYPSLQTISQKTVSAKPQIEMESGSYNALRQILIPQGRFPIGQKDEDGYAFGLFGMSEDALHSHSWQGLALINPETGRPIYDILYTYKRWNPRLDARTYNLPEEVSYHQYTGWWRKQGFDAVVSFPQTLESSVYTKLFTPSIGLKTQTVKHSKGILYPKLHNYIGYTAGMQYSRGTQALRDVVPHYAYTIALYADWSHKTFNSDFTAQQISGLANVFLPTPVEHHQLQFLTSYQERRGLFDYDYFGALPVGYSDDHFRKQFRLKTAYHFPIVYVEWELPRVPFYIDYIAGSFFYDWGTSWRTPSLSWRDRKRYSTGIQLTIANIAFRSLPIVFEIRYLYRSSDKKWMSEFSSALQ